MKLSFTYCIRYLLKVQIPLLLLLSVVLADTFEHHLNPHSIEITECDTGEQSDEEEKEMKDIFFHEIFGSVSIHSFKVTAPLPLSFSQEEWYHKLPTPPPEIG